MADGSHAALPRDIGQRIRRLRGKLGLTQLAFAELIGASSSAVNRWENGQSHPSPLAWQRILAAEEHGLDALLPKASAPGLSRNDARGTPTDVIPGPDFSANPEIVRAVAEAERLSYGYIFNPAFATEISRIDPLPHQRIAVYQHMLSQPRLRFLLADDAGAGKTIMAGLYIREMLTRRLIRRVLVIPPAGLIGNWENELRVLFSLQFREVTGADCRDENPFAGPGSELVVASVDTLAGGRAFERLAAP